MKRGTPQSLTEGPLFSGIIKYTIPIILTSVLQLLFNAADLVVVGNFCGSIALAAVGATGAITNLIVNLFIGLSVGAGVVVAHDIGAGDNKGVYRAIHTSIPTALVGGVVMTIVGVSFCETFLTWMGTPESVLPLSTVYMQIYFGGITFTMVYNFAASILRAAGDTKTPLIALTIAGVLNVAMNVLFVTVFNMNVAGVALATTLSQGLAAGLSVYALMRREDVCKFFISKMRFYAAPLKRIIRIGLPAGIQGSLFSISNVLIQSSVNSFGDVVMSGNAAAANIEAFVYVSMNAFHQTVVNFIGQNTGARKFDRVHKIMWICLGCVTVAGVVVGGIGVLFGKELLSVYISDSAEALSYGLLRLTCICLPYFICGWMDVTTGALRGMGSSVVPMIISVVGVCGIRIAWIYTIFQMPQFHTLECLYFSYVVSWLATFLCQLISFLLVFRKKSRAGQ